MQLIHGADFVINLETDNVILHGSVEESAGVILRGSVVLNCHENIKVKSIVLKFQGKTKVNWTEGHGSHQKHYKEERNIMEHEWSFLPVKRKPYHFAVGRYQWDFELPLPGDLPETVQHEHGQVSYRLKAVAERPAFSMNYVAKRNVLVTRVLLPSSLELNQSLVISNEWVDKLSYNISVPRKVYSCGNTIPITFDLIALAPALCIRSVTCALKEYATLSTGEHRKTEGKIIQVTRDDQFVNPSDRWTMTEELHVPSSPDRIQSDTSSDLIEIRHKLKFTVSLMNADGHISELRAAIPVIIAPLAAEDDANELPAYEDAWKTMPYDAAALASLVASGSMPPSVAISIPNAAASRAAAADSHSTDNSEDENGGDRLPWEGIDLSRVPSYTTAIRSNRLYSFSGSLPTYESIAIPGTSS